MTFEEIKQQLKKHAISHDLISKGKDCFKIVLDSCVNGEDKYKKALREAVDNDFGFEDIYIEFQSQTFCFDHESIGNIMIYTNFIMRSHKDDDSNLIGKFVYITDIDGRYFDESFFIYRYHI